MTVKTTKDKENNNITTNKPDNTMKTADSDNTKTEKSDNKMENSQKYPQPRKDSNEPARAELHYANADITSPTTVKALLEKEEPLPEDIIEDLIPVGLTVFQAPPKGSRTRFTLNMAARLSQGTPTFGSLKTKKKRVLYLGLSEDTYRIRKQLRKIDESSVGLNRLNIEAENVEDYKSHSLKGRLGAYIIKRKFGVVIIDTFLDAIELPKRGNNRHILEVATALRKLANDTQTAIIVVHNSNKENLDENIFQQKSLEAASDNVLLLTSPFREGDQEYRTLHHYGRMFPKKEIYLSSPIDGPEFTQIDKLPVSESDLMDKLVLLSHYGLTQKDMAYVLDLSQGYVSKLLKNIDPSEFTDDVITHDDIEEFNAPEDEWDSLEDESTSEEKEEDNLD